VVCTVVLWGIKISDVNSKTPLLTTVWLVRKDSASSTGITFHTILGVNVIMNPNWDWVGQIFQIFSCPTNHQDSLTCGSHLSCSRFSVMVVWRNNNGEELLSIFLWYILSLLLMFIVIYYQPLDVMFDWAL